MRSRGPLSFYPGGSVSRKQAPEATIFESPLLYKLVVSLPGHCCDDFGITIEDGVLSIAVHQSDVLSAEAGAATAAWTRQFVLPGDADTILGYAIYENGELVINIPRANTLGHPRKASIYVY